MARVREALSFATSLPQAFGEGDAVRRRQIVHAVYANPTFGYSFMLLVERWAHLPAVGVLILVLAATGTTAAYSYVFGSVSRDVLLTSSLFLLMGAGCRVIFDPRKSAVALNLSEDLPSGEKKESRNPSE